MGINFIEDMAKYKTLMLIYDGLLQLVYGQIKHKGHTVLSASVAYAYFILYY